MVLFSYASNPFTAILLNPQDKSQRYIMALINALMIYYLIKTQFMVQLIQKFLNR